MHAESIRGVPDYVYKIGFPLVSGITQFCEIRMTECEKSQA